MNYIKKFKNAQSLSVSVGNTYLEDQLMHIYLDNFHQGEKYYAQIAIHLAGLRREGNILINTIYLFHPFRLTI